MKTNGVCLLIVGILGWCACDAFAGALHAAARKGDLATVRKLVAADPGGVDQPDSGSGQTALLVAVKAKQEQVAVFLLSKGASPDASPNVFRTTPLIAAAEQGLPTLVQKMIDAGADVSLTDAADRTALHHAASTWNLASVQKLIAARADVDAKAGNGATPLHLALSRSPLAKADEFVDAEAAKVVGALLAAGADPNLTNSVGRTPLHFAAYWNAKICARKLLDAGADLSALDEKRMTPAAIAIERGHAEMAIFLNNAAKKAEAAE